MQISAHWHLSIAEHARLEPILSFDDDYLANPAGALMNIASFEIAAGTPDNARDPILQAEALIKEMRPAPRKANREFHLFSLKAQLCEHDGDYPQAAVFYRLSAVRAGEYSGILAQIPALARHQAVCDRLGEPNATRGLTVALIGVDFELPDTIGLSSSVALTPQELLERVIDEYTRMPGRFDEVLYSFIESGSGASKSTIGRLTDLFENSDTAAPPEDRFLLHALLCSWDASRDPFAITSTPVANAERLIRVIHPKLARQVHAVASSIGNEAVSAH